LSGVEQRERLIVRQASRVVGRDGQRRTYLTVQPNRRAFELPAVLTPAAPASAPYRLAQFLPVPVHRVEVAAPVSGASLRVDRRVQVRPAIRAEYRLGLLPRAPLDNRILVGEPGRGIDERAHVRYQTRIEPRLAALDELRVDRQPFAEGESEVGRPRREFLDVRPWAFRVDVIRGQRGYAAPVVDPGVDHLSVL